MTVRSVVPLNSSALSSLAARGVRVPTYDRSALRPRIAHVGVGGFHRTHLAVYTDDLAAEHGSDWGIIGLGLLPHDARIHQVLARQDQLYTLVEKGSGEPVVRVIGSIVDFVHAPPGADDALARVIADPTTAILSLTITESGYGEPTREAVQSGTSTLDRLAAALDARRRAVGAPLTVLSCDNLPGNGDVAHAALLSAAARVDDELCAWIETHCAFPNSMVDRITPMTSDDDIAWLREVVGLADGWPVVAEPFRQWVFADVFAAGRPAWEDAGALITDRLHDWELYKLRLLNAGHSCMAYLAALSGFTWVDEAFADPTVHVFLDELLHREALPTLTEIPGHPREAYIATVFDRFANTGMRDQIARLCIDGSAKFPTFLLPTIAAQLEAGGPIQRAATALAGWARYLGTVDPGAQSADRYAHLARVHALRALDEPTAFLDYGEVFGTDLRESERFRAAFATAYRRIAADGPLAAMAAAQDGTSTGRV